MASDGFEFCVQRLAAMTQSSTLLKTWSCLGIAKAEIYITAKKKGTKAFHLEPGALEAYSSFCSTFDETYVGKTSLLGEQLKYKSLRPSRKRVTREPLTGGDVWRKYKDLRAWYTNFFLPLWEACVGPDGKPPSGKTHADILEDVLQLLWDKAEEKRIASKQKRDAARGSNLRTPVRGGSGRSTPASLGGGASSGGGSGCSTPANDAAPDANEEQKSDVAVVTEDGETHNCESK
jgi:hypothetical protein